MRRIKRRIGDRPRPRPKAPAGGQAAESSGVSPGVNATADMAALKEGMDAIRTQLQRWGAALGAGAAALLAGLGYTTLHKFFPVPDVAWLVVTALIFGVVAILGSVLMTSNFFRAQRRIIFAPSLIDPATSSIRGIPPVESSSFGSSTDNLDAAEKKLVTAILREHAGEAGFTSIGNLELQAIGYSQGLGTRIGGRRDVSPADRPAEADRLNGILGLAQRRASLVVLERRAERAMGKTRAIFVPTVTGIAILLQLSPAQWCTTR